MKARSIAVAALIFGLHLSAVVAQINSWTNTTSGYWEEPFWSLGVPPSFSQTAIQFTNPNFKALAIGANTTANHADSLRIRNFAIDAPPGSGNLLLLNYAGLNVPLDVTGWLTIGTNGTLLSYYSALDTDSVMLQGRATFAELARTRVGSIYLTNEAELVLSNGWFEALTEAIQSVHETVDGFLTTRGSTWTQYGGTNQFNSMTIESDSTYNLYGGTLKHVGGQLAHIATTAGPTEAALNVVGGIADMGEVILGERYDGPDFLDESRGWVRQSGGLFKSPRVAVKQGGVYQTGGTNQVGAILLPGPDPWIGPGSRANYILEAGHVASIFVPIGQYHLGSFQQSGGTHTNLQGIVVHENSLYELSAGSLSAPNIDLRGGTFRHSSPTNFIATNNCPQLFISEGGRYSHFGGMLMTFNMAIRHSVDSNYPFLDRGYVQTGGEHRASSIVIDSGGLYYLWRGTLSGDTYISVGAMGQFRLSSNSVVTGNRTFNLQGGGLLFLHSGTNQLGGLRVSGDSDIDFSTNGATIRFSDAGYTNGALDATLDLLNWTRDTDHLYVGSITDEQLRLITFVNPGGYAPGNYRARVTAGSEIVPLEPGRITFTRTTSSTNGNSLTLTWPEGYQLFTATEVDHPYTPVPDATSPYQVSLTELRRFFKLVPVQ